MNWFEEFFGNYTQQFVYIIRILFACVCGVALGWERMLREKEAGIRTHMILAIGAALITCVSMSFESDQSRIAAQIVSGIGFIGAGMIMFRGEALHGLTTAAGIWTTAGIGMAAGSGMYILAMCVTLIVIVCQVIFHTRFLWSTSAKYKYLHAQFVCTEKAIQYIKEKFEVDRLSRLKVEAHGDKLVADAVIRTSTECGIERLAQIMNDNPDIIFLERLDGNAY